MADDILRIAPNRYAYARYMARALANAVAATMRFARQRYPGAPTPTAEQIAERRLQIKRSAQATARKAYKRHLAEYDEYVHGLPLQATAEKDSDQ